MSTERLALSEKYKAFLRCDAPVEFLEGTTAAGKTTVGLFKFMCKVAESPKKLHILAADDTGTAEKNIINKDLGILDDFGILAEYKGNGSGEYKMPLIPVSYVFRRQDYLRDWLWKQEQVEGCTWRSGMDVCTSMRSIQRILILFVKHLCAVIIL